MRYYLDTNILVFLLTSQSDEISNDIKGIIADYGSQLFTSTICVQELIHLCQIGKVYAHKRKDHIFPASIISWLDETGIGVVDTNRLHLQTFSEMPIIGGHHDPFDRLIVAQAISDKIPLISSDTKLDRYTKYGLQYICNER